MDDAWLALVIWLPAGTALPFLISLLTGSDWRGALIEATLFGTLGLLIYPTALALMIAPITTDPRIEFLFIAGFILATGSMILFRRRAVGSPPRR